MDVEGRVHLLPQCYQSISNNSSKDSAVTATTAATTTVSFLPAEVDLVGVDVEGRVHLLSQ